MNKVVYADADAHPERVRRALIGSTEFGHLAYNGWVTANEWRVHQCEKYDHTFTNTPNEARLDRAVAHTEHQARLKELYPKRDLQGRGKHVNAARLRS